MSKNRKSEVWDFFTQDHNQKCTCNLCGKFYKSGGGTTNLRNHLLRKHPKTSSGNPKEHAANESSANKRPRIDFYSTNSSATKNKEDAVGEAENNHEHEEKEEKYEEDLIDFRSIGSASSITVSRMSNRSCRLSQPTIENVLNETRSYESGGSKETMLTQALIFMICKDNYPLKCTEKEGLRKLLKVAVPLYQIPSRRTITRQIEQKYITLQNLMSKKLQHVSCLALTTDIATVMNATRSFIVLTAHFIDKENNSMVSVALGVNNLMQHHTAYNISMDLKTMFNEWKISKENIVSITTDNGANIVAGVKKLMSEGSNSQANYHVSCFAHNLNLVVTKALGNNQVQDIVTIIEKVKTIVAYFKHSNVAQDQLRHEQQKEGKKDGTYLYLIQEVSTRWNSTFYCLESVKTLVLY